ncbi:cysteine protease StiP family protein [Carnobacterium gallinarum]|uniref:cysteine protease StiP family protein n=1 Tax=Carnobacterium gallinarum TaxID=2749 RepID=UPI00054D41DF|nr:cysteine protease StiP family protein [Carnobacterium gallinarum]
MKPFIKGSYSDDDVIFLLQDISKNVAEIATAEREKLIQSGIHYSEMLPVEYQPTAEYIALFKETLADSATRIALSVGIVAEKIITDKLKNYNDDLDQVFANLVLVSLARAGTPIGVLVKRYFKFVYHVDIPHYSISIIRGRGIDEVALDYIYQQSATADIQFIDGWTGKGAITKELTEACMQYNQAHQLSQPLSDKLAVLADTGSCTTLFGTRDDFLIPSACLNSTVSGLVSRTVLNEHFIKPGEVHGAKYYQEFEDLDLSNDYVDAIMEAFRQNQTEIEEQIAKSLASWDPDEIPDWAGMKAIEQMKIDFHYDSIHFIKPGVGETTRVLLRRVPEKLLINPERKNDLRHILLLAKELHVPVEEYHNMPYSCCGLIKQQAGEKEV